MRQSQIALQKHFYLEQLIEHKVDQFKLSFLIPKLLHGFHGIQLCAPVFTEQLFIFTFIKELQHSVTNWMTNIYQNFLIHRSLESAGIWYLYSTNTPQCCGTHVYKFRYGMNRSVNFNWHSVILNTKVQHIWMANSNTVL